MNNQSERRYLAAEAGPVDVSTRTDGQQYITGYSAVFYSADRKGSEYQLWEDCVERIREGAFDRAISEGHDARALFNHDANNLLGRVSNKTCRLSVDKIGLKYEIDVNMADPDHTRVVEKIKRGDLTGSSFAFRPLRTTWEDKDGQVGVRWIEDLQLYDVGPVVYPAYEGSTTGLRSEDGRGHVEEEYRLWKESQIMENDVIETEPVVTEPVVEVTETTDTTATAETRTVTLGDVFELLAELRELLTPAETPEVEPTTVETQTEETPVVEGEEAVATEDRDAENTLEMRRRQLQLLTMKS